MALTAEVNNIAATTFQPTIGNLAADGTHEYQLSARADFNWCVAPIIEEAASVAPLFTGLNAGSLYYFRARAKRADDTREDWSNVLAMRTLDGAARDISPAPVMIQPAMLVVPATPLSITGLDEDPGFPAANVLHDGPTIWQSSRDNTTSELRLEMGDVDIDTIAVLGTNLSETASIRIFAGSTTGYGDFDSGNLTFRASPNLPMRRGFHGIVELPSVERHRYWRIQLIDDRQPRSIVAQHLIMGLNRVSKNHAVEKVETPVDLSTFSRNVLGNPIRSRRARLRRVDFDIAVMKEADFETKYGDLYHLVGTSDPVLCVPNSKGGAFLHDRILYGPIVGGRAVNVASPYYTRTFQIESII